MEIKILSPEEVEFKEKDIQNAFERDLSKLEEGLELIGSEVVIGTGRVDTLAFDSNNSRPVFIEYKRRGEFSKDALIQLMDYLSWFARDENRMAVLEKIIRQRKPDVEDFEPSIRLICVVTDIDDRIKNAIYVISNHVKVFSYMVARDTSNNTVLVPKLEVDNSEVEPQMRQLVSEGELLKKYPHLQEVFSKLKTHLETDGVYSYATARSFRFKKNRVFAKAHFRKRYIQLELRVGEGNVADPDFKYWRQGASDWGYMHIHPSTGVPDKVIGWIEAAKKFSGEGGIEEDEM
ncbi:MAG TPA: endonuclease NucS domain-containing protein [Pyrinomonadaceae bacterium]|nr:endonuclease NucS domain-containing protein [Pyrinomonadaceae bacterium]